MAKTIKTKFTKEEIDEFINNLQNSIGDEKRVKELLHVRSLPIIIAYLKEIGMPEEVVSKADSIEVARIRMIEILTSSKIKNCVVSDKGIEYDYNYNKGYYRREKLGLDENGFFRLSKDRYFQTINDGYYDHLYLMNDMETAYDPRISIDAWRSGRNIDHYMGVLGLKTKRKVIDGVPYIEVYRHLIDGSIEYKKVVDTGLPFFTGNQDSTFEENYEMYTTLFPKLKDWYDGYLFQDYRQEDKRTIKEKSDDIDRVVALEKLYKIDLDIFGLQSNIMNGIKEYRTNKEKISTLIGLLQGYRCETDEERERVASLIQRAQELADRETEFDDKEKMETVKAELSVKDGVRKYGDLDLSSLHQELSGREDKKERLDGIDGSITSINEEYQSLFDEAQRLFDNRDGVRTQTSDVEENDIRARLLAIKSELIEKRENYSILIDEVYRLIMNLGSLGAINITDEWCDKVDDLEDKHGLGTQSSIDMERLFNRIKSLSTDNMRLYDDRQMSDKELLEYELMLCETLLSRIDSATYDFEDWKKELERLRNDALELRADEIKSGQIRLSIREITD